MSYNNHQQGRRGGGFGGRSRGRGYRGGGGGGGRGRDDYSGASSSAGREICGYHLKGKCEYELQHPGQQCRYPHFLKKIGQAHGHSAAVKDVAMWAAQQKLFTCSSDGTIKLWDCASWQDISTLDVRSPAPAPSSSGAPSAKDAATHEKNEGVNAMVLEGPFLFVGFEGPFLHNPNVHVGMIRGWNLDNPAQVFEFRANDLTPFAHAMRVLSLAVATDSSGTPTLFSGSADGCIRYWQMDGATNEFKCRGELEGHVRGVSRLKTFKMGATPILASASVDGTIRLWDLAAYQCVKVLSSEENGHTDAVIDLEFWINGNESFLISGGLDGDVIVWNLAAPFQQLFKERQDSQVTALCGTQDVAQQPILLIGTADGAITVKELPSFAYKTTISRQHNYGHQEAVRRITTGPLNTFFSVSNDQRMFAWQITGNVSAIQSK